MDACTSDKQVLLTEQGRPHEPSKRAGREVRPSGEVWSRLGVRVPDLKPRASAKRAIPLNPAPIDRNLTQADRFARYRKSQHPFITHSARVRAGASLPSVWFGNYPTKNKLRGEICGTPWVFFFFALSSARQTRGILNYSATCTKINPKLCAICEQTFS